MMKKYKWSLLLGSLLSLEANLDQLLFVESTSDKAPYPFFPLEILQMAGAARQLPFSDFRFCVCNDGFAFFSPMLIQNARTSVRS